MKNHITLFAAILLFPFYSIAQVDLKAFDKTSGVFVKADKNELLVRWPSGNQDKAQLLLSLDKGSPLFKSISGVKNNSTTEIINGLDPAFLLTVGKRDLVSQNGWNIFFDKVPLKPFQTHRVQINKKRAAVSSAGSRTIITIDEVSTPGFTGNIEITLYNGSPLLNIAAVMSTAIDSTAIVYDAGLISHTPKWQQVAWSDVDGNIQNRQPAFTDTAVNGMVKYRTIIGNTANGSLAVFPAPHQYF